MRYIVGKPFTWLEEVQLFCMVWIVFQGGSVAFKTHNHVSIEMVVEQFPLKIQTIIMYLVHILVILILGYLFYQSLGFIALFIRNGRKTSMLNIPMWLFYIIAPISICEMIINYINSEYKIAKEFKENKGVENE
jgi:TRAP-type C4-dicarboxylate transport system permease small subunit